MEKQFYDKYGKEFHCATCHDLTTCVNRPEPLYPNCCEQYLRDRIAELEERLKNAIVPKFKVGNVLYYIFRDSVEFMRVNTISKFRDKEKDVFYGNGFGIYWNENELFATKEEALAKLEELKGENK